MPYSHSQLINANAIQMSYGMILVNSGMYDKSDEEGTEFVLLERVTKEKKARRRTRGPYRKSQRVYNTKKQ